MTEFTPGSIYKILNYKTDKYDDLKIISRTIRWLKIDINGKLFDVRVSKVRIPTSESILLDGYGPVFSYDQGEQDEYEKD